MARLRRRVTIYTEPRMKFWIGDADHGYSELILPAEIIDEEMEDHINHLSSEGRVTERNENEVEHMWHWHWTIAETNVDTLRYYLLMLNLESTNDLYDVW